MDTLRIGRSIRALRHRLGWRQTDLAARACSSQPAISRIESGRFGDVSIAMLARIVVALGGELDVRIRWHGEELDRLLDRGHAILVDWLVEILRAQGWECRAEATFAIGGERGSFDILAWHAMTGRLLVVEVKTIFPDVQAMFCAFDRKVRLAVQVAATRGWRVTGVGRVIVMPATATNRRRVRLVASTVASVLPDSAKAAKAWLADPSGPCPAALWLVADIRVANAIRKRRIRVRRQVSRAAGRRSGGAGFP